MEIIPPHLPDYQKKILFSEKRFTVTEAATKVGKTYSHLIWLFGKACEDQPKKGCQYWWVAPVYKQAKIAYNRLKNYLGDNDYFKFKDSDLEIPTPYDSIIAFKSADDPNNLYGEDVFAAVFDEFTRAKQEAWTALRTTLTATKAPCKLIGNYLGIANWGHQLTKKAELSDSEYEYHKITCWDAVEAGILDAKEIEQAREDLPAMAFKRLYLVEDAESENQLIKNEAITDFFTNSFIEDGERFLTADVALYGSDRFVIIVWSGWKITHFYVIKDKSTIIDPQQAVNLIEEYVIKHKIPGSNICFDADGLGVFLRGYLRDAISFHNGSAPVYVQGQKEEFDNLKSQCYFYIATKINKAEVYFEADPEDYKTDITEELIVIRDDSMNNDRKLRVLPKKETVKILGRSPDFSDALMMRSIFDLKRRRKARRL